MPVDLENRPSLLGGRPICPQGPPDWPPQDPETDAALRALIDTGNWGRYHGPHCISLTKALGEYLNSPHVQLCASGTAAVEMALRGLGVGPGDEVILAAYDFKSNFTNVVHVGAKPVLVDVCPDDRQMDVAQLDAAVSSQTRCVITSHLHGGLVDMPALLAWSEAHEIPILEDACQASGASLDGRACGTLGDVGVWSFGGSKLLTAGRGGATFTRRDDVAQRIKLQMERGNSAYPLSEMQAAVLAPQLQSLPDRHRRRAEAVATLRPALIEHGLLPLDADAGHGDPAYYKLGLKYDSARFGDLDRDRFAEAMRAEGIAVDAGFRALHRTHARSRYRAAGSLTNAEVTEHDILTLHHPVLLGNDDDLGQIVTAVQRIHRHAEALRQQQPSPD